MRIAICKDSSEWDSYVNAHTEAANYHRWLWKELIEETYRRKTYYLIAKDEEGVRGVLPLVAIKSWLFGCSLVSFPFSSYGGVLASTTEARQELLARAVELARDLGARHIELRQGVTFEGQESWQVVTRKVAMQVRSPGSADELWNRLSPKLRKRIRYARNHGLSAQWGGNEAVGSFYSVFAENMRNLGTPVYPRDWFKNICRRLAGDVRILSLWDKGQPVASAFLIAFRDTLELPWAASLPGSRDKFSPLLLYWTLLDWAVGNGYGRVDLGRCTPGSGNYAFKRRWICEEKPLHWYYWLASGAHLPDRSPDSPRFRVATRVWKHLPLFVANQIGPRIVRALP